VPVSWALMLAPGGNSGGLPGGGGVAKYACGHASSPGGSADDGAVVVVVPVVEAVDVLDDAADAEVVGDVEVPELAAAESAVAPATPATAIAHPHKIIVTRARRDRANPVICLSPLQSYLWFRTEAIRLLLSTTNVGSVALQVTLGETEIGGPVDRPSDAESDDPWTAAQTAEARSRATQRLRRT
jgi:hypothetical protein